jgi:hypothetical protein
MVYLAFPNSLNQPCLSNLNERKKMISEEKYNRLVDNYNKLLREYKDLQKSVLSGVKKIKKIIGKQESRKENHSNKKTK